MAFLSSFYPQPVVKGTTAGTYAEGDDSRIVGAAQKSANLSDLASASSARANLDLEVGVDVAAFNDSRITGALPAATAGTGSVLAHSGSTGATARTLAARFGEVFHVDDFGAKGDWNGTTGTDDTAAIQNAINAAVAAGGGIVRFGPNKKYRLNTRTSRVSDTIGFNLSHHRHFLRVGSGNLVSNFGSTEMMLYFDGQGATLHATSFSEGLNEIIYVCCRFNTLVFQDLKFTRSAYQITTQDNQSTALLFAPADTNEHKQVLIKNCYFKDNLASISFRHWNIDYNSVLGKCKNVDIVNCIFEHDNGSNRISSFDTSSGISGALVVGMSSWVDNATFDKCKADGLTNSILPSSYFEAMHGFLMPMPIKTNITNCYFTNFCVEIIKASDAETSQTYITIAGNFNQVPIWDGQAGTKAASTISRAIINNAWNLQSLEVGKIYCLFDPNVYSSKRGGFFKLEPKAGGGSYTYAAGEVLNLVRISSDYFNFPSQYEINVGSSFSNTGIILIDIELLKKHKLRVTNCVFDGKPLKTSNGGYIGGTIETWDSPSILCHYDCIVSNNQFVGGRINIYSEVTSANMCSTVITNNSFYKYTELQNQQQSGYIAIWMQKSNTLISNNCFVAEQSRAINEFLWIAANDVIICENSAIVIEASAPSTNGVVVGPRFITHGTNQLFNVIAENNYLKNLQHYGRSEVGGVVAHFWGNVLGSISSIGYAGGPPWEQSSGATIRVARKQPSPDGSTWTVGVTNDGELEVIK